MQHPAELHRINSQISAPEVKLVGGGTTPTVYPTSIALRMAAEQGMDLVEMSAKTTPPICKIFDYKKFKYEQKKKAKQVSANKAVVKELKFRLDIDQHDLGVKLSHAKKFLEQGATVKGMLQLRGAQPYTHQEEAKALISSIASMLTPYGSYKEPSKPPKKGERKLFFIIEPYKGKNRPPKAPSPTP